MIGFDIGGTKCAVSIGEMKNGELTVLKKTVIPTDHSVSAYEMIDRMCRAAEELTDDFSRVGISCGGPLDSGRGVILSPPNLPGWDEIEICNVLRERWGCKCYLQNDANACALAEWKCGAGKGSQNMIFLTFGTGLGAGLILNGRLYEGANGNAGEIGHVRLAPDGPVGYGKAGSAEGFCSGGGIAALGRSYTRKALADGKKCSFCKSIDDLATVSAKTIADAAKAGNEDALAIYGECGEKLGETLSILIDLFNPDRIVIGSVYQRSGELLIPNMQKAIDREALPPSKEAVRILPAKLSENIGDYAALICAEMAD